MKKMLLTALLVPAMALAQSYPSPTFNNLTVNTALTNNGTIGGTAYSNYLASPPSIGGTAANAGAFTTLSASGALSGVGFTNYFASPPAIGGTAANSGAFTGLSASGTVSGTGFTNYFASPPAIGGTAPNAITATSYSQNLAPGSASPAGNCLPTGSGNYCFNQLGIGAQATHDAYAAPTAGAFINGLQVAHYYGGSTMTGGRQSLYVQSSFTAASSGSNTNHNYVAGTFYTQADAGDNGTAPSIANGKGAFFAMNPYVHAYNGATNLLEITGAEFDVAAETGSSMAYKNGLSIVQVSPDAVQGSVYDAAIGISNGSAGLSGWQNGILFGPMNSAWPIASTGCIICTTGTGTAATGIDFSATTLTNFLHGPGGYFVNGSGATSTSALTVTGASALQGGITGNTNGTAAAAGTIGQWQTTSSSAVSLTAGTAANGTSLAVTAGQYIVQCVAQFNPAGTTTFNSLQVGVNTVSATLPAFPSLTIAQWTFTTGAVQILTSPMVYQNLSSSGTLYCPVYANFATSTMTVTTQINILRIH